MLDWLQGYKTYFVCLGAIVTALVAYLNKSISLTELVWAVYGAVAGITLRKGIQTSVKTGGEK